MLICMRELSEKNTSDFMFYRVSYNFKGKFPHLKEK